MRCVSYPKHGFRTDNTCKKVFDAYYTIFRHLHILWNWFRCSISTSKKKRRRSLSAKVQTRPVVYLELRLSFKFNLVPFTGGFIFDQFNPFWFEAITTYLYEAIMAHVSRIGAFYKLSFSASFLVYIQSVLHFTCDIFGTKVANSRKHLSRHSKYFV